MEEDIWYDYTITIDPPDNIEEIVSAIIGFEVWLSPTVIFDLEVNGNPCNTESYQVHTTYASAEYGKIQFDCSNVITGSGSFDVSIRSSKDTGAITGWVDLTYMNNPVNEKGNEVNVQGTDYFIGEYGTVFLQLRDDNGEAVNDGLCLLDVYYPVGVNASHPIWITNAPMFYLPDSSGIYYYDINVPNVTGIYMLDASCSYTFENVRYYEGLLDYPVRTVNYGTFSGDVSVLNAYDDYIYTKCESEVAGTKQCEAEYDYEIDDTNVSSLSLLYMGESNIQSTGIFSVYNWTSASWIELPNYIYYTGQAINFPSGINDVATNLIPDLNNTINSTGWVKVKLKTTFLSAFDQYDNFLQILSSQEGVIVADVKGAGEIHVTENSVAIVENVTSVANALSTFISMKYAGGTEYKSGEEGYAVYQFLEVKSGNPIPINNADWCNITIYYPDNSVFVNNGLMTYLSGSNGMYSYNFTTPSTEGVYKTDAHCYRDDGKIDGYGASTFHVSPWANFVYEIPNDVWNFENRTVTGQEQLWVGGTEYSPDEDVGKIVIRLVDSTNNPVDIADCELGIFYPNNTPYLVMNMTWHNGTMGGVYYADFNLSEETGVHPYGVDCLVTTGAGPRHYYLLDTYHVFGSNVTRIAEEVWTYSTRTLTDYNQSGIFNEFNDLNTNMQNNFTNTNNLINNIYMSLNTTISNLISGISTQIINLDSYLNTTLTRIEWKIDNLNNTLTNITIGNVTLTVSVDEREIAMDTLRIFCYYGAIDIYGQDICTGELDGGIIT